jgi:serine/threonine-protein kinase
VEVALRAIRDAARGLDHAHTRLDPQGNPAHLIHRDISPDNLMLSREGVTKILDFGIVKETGGSDQILTKTGEIKGKIGFMPPEALEGDDLDARADLFALGVTAYWLLCRKRPFGGKSEAQVLRNVLTLEPKPPDEVVPDIPVNVSEIVLELLAKDREERTATAADLVRSLNEVIGRADAEGQSATFCAAMLAHASDPPEERPASGQLSGPMPVAPGARPSSVQLPELPELDDSGRPMRTAESTSSEMMATALQDEPTSPTREPIARVAVLETQPVPALRDEGDAGAGSGGGGRRRLLLAGGVTAALGLVAALIVFGRPDTTVVESAGKPPPVVAPVVPEPREAPPTEEPPAAPPPPTEPAVRVDEPANEGAGVEDGAPSEEEAKPATRTVQLRAPQHVVWRTAAGRELGRGNVRVELPAAEKAVQAVDGKRAMVASAPVADTIDFARLPTGTLTFLVLPYADVRIGQLELGTTPVGPQKLTAGAYRVTLTYKDKRATKRVRVRQNRTTTLRHDFREN